MQDVDAVIAGTRAVTAADVARVAASRSAQIARLVVVGIGILFLGLFPAGWSAHFRLLAGTQVNALISGPAEDRGGALVMLGFFLALIAFLGYAVRVTGRRLRES
jgi:hypothetical protein